MSSFGGDTGNVNDLRNAALAVTAVFSSLFAILYAMKYICCRSATYSGRSTAEGSHGDRIADIAAAITNNERSKIPFSSRIRRIYLESALKHEIFHEMANDIEKGVVQKHVAVVVKKISNESTAPSTVPDDNITNDDGVSTASNQNEDKKDEYDTDGIVSLCDDVETSHCAICYEALHEGDEITTSNCNKTFHRQCIMEWLMQHDLCPYCRNPFKDICDSIPKDYLTMDCDSTGSEVDTDTNNDDVIAVVMAATESESTETQ